MGNGIGAVVPGEPDGLSGLVRAAEGSAGIEKPLYERLLEAARGYLEKAGIRIPHATLEVINDKVVMHGAPEGSAVLVCALEGPSIKNYL